ncbi:MAG: hypothetical protein ACXABY_18775 [Candidatus Thorarchaeota archaeon]
MKEYDVEKWELNMTKENNLKEVLGSESYRKLISSILMSQAEIIRMFDMPIGSEFLSLDNSKLIWCVIGNSINEDDRKTFEFRTDHNNIRAHAVDKLKKHRLLTGADLQKLKIELLGEDSISISSKYNEANPEPKKKSSWFTKIFGG